MGTSSLWSQGSAARVAQQELAKTMSEKERERRISEHIAAEMVSVAERGENILKAKEMVDQEYLRQILKHRRVQEKQAIQKIHQSVREELRLKNGPLGRAMSQRKKMGGNAKETCRDASNSSKASSVTSISKTVVTTWKRVGYRGKRKED